MIKYNREINWYHRNANMHAHKDNQMVSKQDTPKETRQAGRIPVTPVDPKTKRKNKRKS